MAAPDEEESFRRFLEEMSGDSRDYGIRKTLDQRVRAYLQSLDAGRIGEMGLCGWTIVTIPTWIIVDRGRITCRFERFASRKLFSARIDVDSAVGPTQKKVILVTMDLNDSNKIQRMEYRLLCKEHDVAGIPNWDWDETVHSIKTKPVVINYNI
ncbi:hypothetical protein CGCFRS4_v008909 [Colletotrichum fructicola]|uniref:Uncharacterized protein n=1 Tax=Colletotrichum fructicola (strain Nara gc5) TaxID=1213859 RepID=L2FW02_COLFN|nr:hypothetical protein CGCFRS4_v008909 [Colletotrichum fructicola]